MTTPTVRECAISREGCRTIGDPGAPFPMTPSRRMLRDLAALRRAGELRWDFVCEEARAALDEMSDIRAEARPTFYGAAVWYVVCK